MISVLIPFRADYGHRDRLADWNSRRWKALLPDAEIIFGTDDSEVFNRGRARNLAFMESTGETVIFADADTAAQREDVLEAVHLVEHGAPWVLPYTVYYNMCETDTESLLQEEPGCTLWEPTEWEHRLLTAISGTIVMSREAFLAVNGYDEDFRGWGYEDDAFCKAMNALVGAHERLPGYVLHLWHPIAPDGAFNSPTIDHNRVLFRQYESAKGNPTRMAALRGL